METVKDREQIEFDRSPIDYFCISGKNSDTIAVIKITRLSSEIGVYQGVCMQASNKVLLKNTIMLYVTKVSAYVFPLITFPYLTRVLMPEKYGVVTFSNAFMSYFILFVDFGFLLSSTRECALHRNDPKKLSQIVMATIQGKLILSIVGLVILMPLLFLVPSLQDKRLFILLSYLTIIIKIFIPDYLFRGLERMEIVTYRTLVGRSIYTMLIFFLIRSPSDFYFIPIISSIGECVIVFATWMKLRNIVRIEYISLPIKEIFISMRTSSIYFLSRIASTVYSSSNIIILGFLYDDSKVALFGVAHSLIKNIRGLYGPIADSLYPYMISKRNYRLIWRIIAFTFPMIMVGTIVLFLLSDKIIILFAGPKYEEASSIFRAMLPLVVITLPLYLLGFPMLGAMGRIKDANFSVIFGALFYVVVVTVLFLVNRINFISLAYTTGATESFILVYRFFCVRRGISDQQRRVERINSDI
jgi:PST family polysaccharide transporter